METELYEHNKKAYENVLKMLEEKGKAAVIHPTGTGKSFIGFKLCEDNADKKICWISPSENIFKTQLENLKKSGSDIPKNITFFTYAKLMYLTDKELSETQADIIILDEFHRAGSSVWGERLKKFMTFNSEAKILGLSATNIRYLDNRRDMADELFEGNIASEITLGEAVVRGILKAPLYISTVFSYKKELEKYETKIKLSKYCSVRNKAEKYLEDLRKIIENSDGLDEIFSKYMPDKTGKYIVFCSNKEQLFEMINHTHEWFDKVDKSPKIYKVFTGNENYQKEFDDFKSDKSNHLKLLFCIDMLNEGIHSDDIDGVILFRPTVSPTVYKQQIGRALTTGKKYKPIIFDIINNFENLNSIGALEKEMNFAVTYFKEHDEEDKILADRFEVTGIVRECAELFEKLNETLSASWDEMYSYAKEYYETHHDLEVPRRYKTENNLSLGAWIDTQRRIRNEKADGIITKEQIEKLDEIKMRWGSFADMNWETNYGEAVKYFIKYKSFTPAKSYVTENKINLGLWCANLRAYRKSETYSSYLTDERIELLNKIGMVWEAKDHIFEKNYEAAFKYYKANGNLDVPSNYVTDDGIKLGYWIRNLRRAYNKSHSAYRLPDKENIEKLNEIGMIWTDKYSRDWDKGFEHAEKYYKEHGNLNVLTTYKSEDGFPLGKWLSRNRSQKGGIKITEERRVKLDSIGMMWGRN